MSATAPLQDLLESVLGRLSTLEAKVGIDSSSSSSAAKSSATLAAPTVDPSVQLADAAPFVKAYDEYMTESVEPFVESIRALKPDDKKVGEMAQSVKDAWMGVRSILVLASQSKKPSGALPTELGPYLKPVQASIGTLGKLRLDRVLDWHQKALLELCGALSWILITPPPQTPRGFVEEAKSSCMYWANKVHKEYKNKKDDAVAEAHMTFYKTICAVGNGLSSYVQKHHLTGLTWNPKGVSLAEAAVMLESQPEEVPASAKRPKAAVSAGGMGSLMAELQKKQTADGSSAATGLKHVSRDQQTWRKEYKGEKSSVIKAESGAPKSAAASASSGKKQPLRGIPLLEYQTRGHKWVVEHHTKESSHGKPLEVEIADPKQQVYVYNCQGVTIQIKGKVKSIILDRCSQTACVFESCISACEVVNSQKIQLQTTGVCPTFTIDKTDGLVVYLSEESASQSSFVTSQSSEMNVSYPVGDEMKELPIPEQFIHKLSPSDGKLSSEVSDLYH